jgi:hypothetical protein
MEGAYCANGSLRWGRMRQRVPSGNDAAGVSAMVIVTPGPGTAVTISGALNALRMPVVGWC